MDGQKDEFGNLVCGPLLMRANADAETIVIPPQVHELGSDDAFRGVKARKIVLMGTDGVFVLPGLCGDGWSVRVEAQQGEKWLGHVGACYLKNNPKICAVEAAENDQKYRSTDGIIYSKDGEQLLCCPLGRTKKAAIPEGVKEIRQCAFGFGKSGVKEIAFPESLREISNSALGACRIGEAVLPKNVTFVGINNFKHGTHIGQESLRPIKGLLGSCVCLESSGARAVGHVLRLDVGSIKLVLPSEMDAKKMAGNISLWDNGFLARRLCDEGFAFAANSLLMEDTALETLAVRPFDSNAWRYISGKSGRMAARYAKSNDCRRLMVMAKNGLFSKEMAVQMLDGQGIAPETRAYLLEICGMNNRDAEMEL